MQNKILLGPGPTNIDERVKSALSREPISHLDPDFFIVLDEISSSLRKIFQTKNKVTFTASGTGSSGMEMSMINLIEPGEKVLILKNGEFSSRMESLAQKLKADVSTITVEWGESFDQSFVIEKIKSIDNLKLVCAVHAETSTGVLQEIDLIGDFLKETEILFLVDAVTSLSGIDLRVDEWGIDSCFSGSQKCLSVPPGLAPITFSDKALSKIKKRNNLISSWYFDLEMLINYWGKDRVYHHTAPVNMLFALNEALNISLDEGLNNRFERHKRNGEYFLSRLKKIGLQSFVNEDKFKSLPMLKSVLIPDRFNDKEFREKLLKNHNLEIGGGLGPTKGKIWRFGLMGFNSRKELIDNLFDTLEIYIN
tara:strand:+ start:34797 stop:35894 length:1098 start_codon:yes stop_codon:yes gene_type:complete